VSATLSPRSRRSELVKLETEPRSESFRRSGMVNGSTRTSRSSSTKSIASHFPAAFVAGRKCSHNTPLMMTIARQLTPAANPAMNIASKGFGFRRLTTSSSAASCCSSAPRSPPQSAGLRWFSLTVIKSARVIVWVSMRTRMERTEYTAGVLGVENQKGERDGEDEGEGEGEGGRDERQCSISYV
jgi:hypothetical protein